MLGVHQADPVDVLTLTLLSYFLQNADYNRDVTVVCHIARH